MKAGDKANWKIPTQFGLGRRFQHFIGYLKICAIAKREKPGTHKWTIKGLWSFRHSRPSEWEKKPTSFREKRPE